MNDSANPKLLLVVDAQNGFVTTAETRATMKCVQALANAWRERRWPIIASRFINIEDSNWRRLRNWHEMTNEPETMLYDGLQLDTPYVFKKATYSAWSDDVSAVCVAKGVKDIVIAGVDTNECVLATAIAVFDAGYRPIVVRDATASSGGQKPHKMALELLSALLGQAQVVDVKSLLD